MKNMIKLNKISMLNKWDNKQTNELMGAIMQLRTKAEAKKFFRDLLTEEELIEFGNRWLTARLLTEDVSYTKIQNRTGLSSRTIARVSKWLNNGKDGYKLILARLKLKVSSTTANHFHTNSVEKGVV